MRVEIHCDHAPEVFRRTHSEMETRYRTVIRYEQPDCFAEVCVEYMDKLDGQWTTLTVAPLGAQELRTALRAVDENSLDAMLPCMDERNPHDDF
jgi:predicted metalloprotease